MTMHYFRSFKYEFKKLIKNLLEKKNQCAKIEIFEIFHIYLVSVLRNHDQLNICHMYIEQSFFALS